jgi:hypothetical protein
MKVGIQNKVGRLILVWNDGKRRTMATTLGGALARSEQQTTPSAEQQLRRRKLKSSKTGLRGITIERC